MRAGHAQSGRCERATLGQAIMCVMRMGGTAATIRLANACLLRWAAAGVGSRVSCHCQLAHPAAAPRFAKSDRVWRNLSEQCGAWYLFRHIYHCRQWLVSRKEPYIDVYDIDVMIIMISTPWGLVLHLLNRELHSIGSKPELVFSAF
eukprot:350758-Chlamydomonas_euryale.AAC.6